MQLPPIEADSYHLDLLLTPEQRALQLKVRTLMENEIKPLINKYWLKGEFPHEIIPRLASLINSVIVGRAITGFSAFV